MVFARFSARLCERAFPTEMRLADGRSRRGLLAEARRLTLAGKVRALLLLQHDLERGVFAGRRPEVVFFYNTQAMTTGNMTQGGVNAAL